MKSCKETKILVRFDDICPTMDFEQFERAIELLDKYDIKPLIGVIPDCKDPDLFIDSPHEDFWEYLKILQSKGYTIAMHGYQHVFDSKKKGIVVKRNESEFAGHSLDVQISKIKRGKEILETHGIITDVFFAPAHSYDWNTLKALAECGFRFLSDSKGYYPYDRYGIKCLPCRDSGCPRIRKSGLYTAVFHAHEWTKPEKKLNYDLLKKLLEEHKSEIVKFEEYSNIESMSFAYQRFVEIVFCLWQLYCLPYLRKIYRKILK